ncbi:MAG: ORF6N domain-containing protein [Proteobacteria bacterium]|nr:ORF6N domain-containing protein [Pseudomonadota bacterium]
MPKNKALVPVEKIENKILLIRGEKVIIDADLAEQLQEVVI